MAKYLDEQGLRTLWAKVKERDKAISDDLNGKINDVSKIEQAYVNAQGKVEWDLGVDVSKNIEERAKRAILKVSDSVYGDKYLRLIEVNKDKTQYIFAETNVIGSTVEGYFVRFLVQLNNINGTTITSADTRIVYELRTFLDEEIRSIFKGF